MATNSFIAVPPDSVGKKLYTQQHTIDAVATQIPVYHLASAIDPSHIQLVDGRGQAFIRFADGSPSMDALGNLRVSQSTILGSYEYTQGSMSDLFQDKTAVGGSVNWIQERSETVLTVNSSNGSSVKRTTNRYHYYQPGVGNNAIFTLAHGDAGKANNVRRWGYFDDNNGLFFELNGTTLYVVLRSNTSGVVVDTKVPQFDFNSDRVDGTGISKMNLDLTKANFYFIDYAWLGVGEVRFGILDSTGERNIIHIFRNPNNNIGAYMQSGSLPMQWENFNTGVTASTSELKCICAAVYAEGRTDYTYWRFSDIERTTPVTVTTNTPILSMRVSAGSRVGIYPEGISVFVTGGNVKLMVVDDAVLTGATWSISGEGVAEGDIGATVATGGSKFKTFYCGAGVTNLDLTPFYETNDEGYHRLADDSGSYVFSLLATKLDGTTVTIGATLQYKELH